MHDHPQPAGPLVADALSDFASRLRYEDIPETIREQAKHHILDVVGICNAAAAYEFAGRTLAGLRRFGGGESVIIGMHERLSLRDALLMNGVLAHGIDYDDTYLPGGLHPTASCFPCALGVGAEHRVSGRELLTAYVLGVETAARVARVAGTQLLQIGFHPTGLIATFGCTLIAGRLLGASTAQLTMAQGLALSLAPCSSREYSMDTAWNKRAHPGAAGIAGITSATMAAEGFVGTQRPYEGRYGLYAIHLGDRAQELDLAQITAGLGTQWEFSEVAIKPFPAGQMGIACLDAAIAIGRAHRIHSAEVKSIRALIPRQVIPIMCEPLEKRRRPPTPYAAQFSLPYGIACGLQRGRFTLDEIEEPVLSDPEILDLASKFSYAIDPDTEYPKYYSGEVIVTLNDGRELRHRERINRGAKDHPVSAPEIRTKFMDNALRVMPRARAEAIAATILHLERIADVRDLARALAAPE
jgi:2-methylcitrate dehydratase PrpD